MENESKIKKVLYNEVSLVMAIVGAILSITFWVVNPQTALEKRIILLEAQVENNRTVSAELEKIKNNDLHELQLRMDKIEERQIEELKAIARVEALLGRK